MRQCALAVDGITKKFGLRTVLSNVTFEARAGDRVAVTGRNGSGKSTLLKILAGAAERTSGTVRYAIDDAAVSDDARVASLGYVAPYLQLYTEFTAWEHVGLMQRMRGRHLDVDRATELFARFGLERRIHDELRTFSSGMLQRVKYVCALVHSPSFLFLDEPMSNFDVDAARTVRELVLEASPSTVIVLATNDADDLTLATHTLAVETATYAAAG